ncbi:MAG TPA: ABC transporter ATP-binding protein [Phycisphaerae bacterium]|nr:ABC transporter ATP-binding protein [Phycisphaerae bacterium]
MNETAIQLAGVTKCFRRFASRRAMISAMLGFAGSAGSAGETNGHAAGPPRGTREFWALKGIDLSIGRGETWGIVGRNGSGKSTLLQIIAGTLQATGGSVRVAGRVAALLELGSGFHPEFTGRENVFFQGQIQGCGRRFIEGKFDQIVDFAGIGDFVDQPVKTYSSGMMVRLAFSVTIALDPDILIVDEALAVGDEAFQRKCFARIRTLQDKGCTVLFVSHAGHQIIELCDHALLLDSGEKLLAGEPKRVVSQYHRMIFSPAEKLEALRAEIRAGAQEAAVERPDALPAEAVGDGEDHFDPNMKPQSTLVYPSLGARIEDARIERPDGSRANMLVRGRAYVYAYDVHFETDARKVRFGMLIKTVGGFELGGAVSHLYENRIDAVAKKSVVTIRFAFTCALQAGVYFLNAGVMAAAGEEPGEPASGGGAEVFIHRVVDAAMFRVQPERGTLATGALDLGFKPAVDIRPESDAPAESPESAPETESTT